MRRLFLHSVTFLIGIGGFPTPHALHAGEEVLREPVPAWVAEKEIDFSPATEEEERTSGGFLYLLDDHQVRVEAHEGFTHRAVRILTASGVDSLSRLLFNFEPGYQTLVLHRLRIHRDGEVLDRLPEQAIRILERETDLESNLYNGFLTAEMLLGDIRVGDEVEWAFSIRGRNPIYRGRFSERYGLAPSMVKRRVGVRILLPPGREEVFRVWTSDTVPPGTLKREGAVIEADLTHPEVWEDFPNAPVWHYPYPWFSVSEYQTWGEVVDWALPLYSEVDALPEGLLPVRDRIRNLAPPSHQVREALQYVQDTLRYISLSTGLHTHKPYPMADVLARRYGDCKDNAHMLVALLRSLGFEAWPALVHTRMRHTIADPPPTPDSFNHVIVAMDLPDGSRIWMDPTFDFQRGPLRDIFVPDYGHALLIREGEERLTEMNGQGMEASLARTEETYHFPEARVDPIRLLVKTEYHGAEADDMREYLAGTSLSGLQDGYQDYYSRLYGEVEALSPLQVGDNLRDNILTIREKWRLHDPWRDDSDWDYHTLDFQPSMKEQLKEYPGSLRVGGPYALSYPQRLEHTIRIFLPFEIPFETQTEEWDTPHFRFAFRDEVHPTGLRLYYEYHTKTDHVPAADVPAFVKEMKEAEHFASYGLANPWEYRDANGTADQTSTGESFQPVPGLVVFFLVCIGLGAGLGVLEGRSHHPPPLVPPDVAAANQKLRGINGWLLLPVFGFFWAGFGNLAQFIDDSHLFMGRAAFDNLRLAGGESLNRFGMGLLGGNLLFYGAFFGFAPFHVLNTFRKKRRVPRGFILFYLTTLLFNVLDLIFLYLLPEIYDRDATLEMLPELAVRAVAACIWCAYFTSSLRVKLTFTH